VCAPGVFSGGMQMFGVRGMTIGAALTFVAVLWWAARAAEPVAEGPVRPRELPASHAIVVSANAWAPPADRGDAAGAPIPESDAGFERYVSEKFRYLIEAPGRSAADADALRAALLERERLVTAINTAVQGTDQKARAALLMQRQQLAGLDERIRMSLPAADLAAFDVLKDSQMEQFQLDEFARGISKVAPITETERKAILFSKLACRLRFRAVLDESGLMDGELPPPQRQAALPGVLRALRESHASFLQEARQHLSDDERYTLLANYENSEHAAELEKLKRIASDDMRNEAPAHSLHVFGVAVSPHEQVPLFGDGTQHVDGRPSAQ
jgi:hypothetical protein